MAKLLRQDRVPGTSYDYAIGRKIVCLHCQQPWETQVGDAFFPIFDDPPTGDCVVPCPRCGLLHRLSPDDTPTIELR